MDIQPVQWFVRWADYAQIATPFVALVGFIFLGKQIIVANKQAKYANDQAKSTEEQVKHMKAALELSKNSLMPRLFLDASYKKTSVSTNDAISKTDYEGLALRIDNIGSGMATCSLLTLRDDLSTISCYDPIPFSKTDDWSELDFYDLTRITDYSIGSEQSISFLLKWSSQRRLDPDITTLSSLSMYYQDVYSRIFRSRIFFVWKHDLYGWHVEIVGREYSEVDELPMNPHSDTDVSLYSRIEGGQIIQDNPFFRVLQFDSSREKLLNLSIAGIPLTNDQIITLVSYDFNSSGDPIYTLQIDGFAEFKISALRNNAVLKVQLNSPKPNEKIRLNTVGLNLTENPDDQLPELYIHVTREILKFLKSPIQRERGQLIIF